MRLSVQDARNGFTLLELMIVIAIIGTLAAIAIPNYISHREKATCAATETDAFNIMRVLTDYFSVPAHANIITPVSIDGNIEKGFASKENSIQYPILSGSNTAVITTNVTGGYTIVVQDGSKRCDQNYQKGNIIWNNWTCTLNF